MAVKSDSTPKKKGAPMNTATLRALKASIAHWKRLATGTQREFEMVSSADCALCLKFLWQQDRCAGCPVKARTGVANCVKTPWLAASLTWRHRGIDSQEFRAAAKNELAFLVSLLPAARKTPTSKKTGTPKAGI